MSEPRADAPPVFILCGFMGTGKTATGKALAHVLDVEFIDTDAVIEREQGMTITDVFSQHGEAFFRELEADLCARLDVSAGAVVATGGGMPVPQKNHDHLAALGTMILLDAGLDAILARVERDGTRPVLGESDGKRATDDDRPVSKDERRRAETLLHKRQTAYHRISEKWRFDTSMSTPEQTVQDILASTPWTEFEVHVSVDVPELPGSARDVPSYSRVYIAPGISGKLGRFIEELRSQGGVFILTPPHIRDLHLARVTPSLERHGIPFNVIDVDDGDANKTLTQAARIIDELISAGAARDSVIVAMGGGVTGDVAGFVASIYMRGVALVQMPTTLLAQVDASIGGKTGVNHPSAKNLIGAVHQPHFVISDPLFLQTLPNEELSAGMAEVIKTAMIGTPELLRNADGQNGGSRLYSLLRGASVRPWNDAVANPGFFSLCVFESAAIKASVVETDPYERDLRRVLNLGHTLGHALEATLSYQGLRHGEAVGLGLLVALRVAVKRGVAQQEYFDEVRGLLEWCGLPTVIEEVDESAVRKALALDKKRRAGRLTFVLPHRPGHVEIVDDVSEDELLASARS